MLKDPSLVVPQGRVELPQGYTYAEQSGISIDELHSLDAAANGPYSSPIDRANWHCPGYMGLLIDVGIRSAGDELVGMGRLLLKDYAPHKVNENLARGDMSNLMVHRDHRGIGLGTAILLERIRIADELGANKLFIDGLSNTNTIRDMYAELGFMEDASGQLKRHVNLAA